MNIKIIIMISMYSRITHIFVFNFENSSSYDTTYVIRGCWLGENDVMVSRE